jgi:PEP-CTERM motif
MRKTLGFLSVVFCLFLLVPQSKADTCGLVSNCGFESGDFSSWTLTGNDTPGALGNLYGVEGTDPDGTNPNSGNFQAFFGDQVQNATTLQQIISTVAGESYTVSWFLAQDTAPSAEYSNAFSASFGGVSLVNLTAMPIQGYTEYFYTATATSTSTALDLTFGNGLGYFLLDDVSVAPVPEPSTWTMMLAGIMGCLLLWKSGLVTERGFTRNM